MKRILLLLMGCALAAFGQVSVLSNRYDNNRTGTNSNETILNTTNVNSQQFGKLFQYQVDSSVYAQPLYVPNLTIPNLGKRNVLFICTMKDTVYAFDADQAVTLWSVNFTNAKRGVTAVPISDIVGHTNGDIVGPVGIEGTPVIDPVKQTMYLVARTKETVGQTTSYVQRIHALRLTDGSEELGGPVEITASAAGTGEQSASGQVPFNAKMNNQRMGLALANGQLIIAWSSHEDAQPYHGWVMSYDATTLAQTGAFCDTPNGGQGGIWASGRAPAVDASGNIFLFTGNGTTNKAGDFSEGALRFTTKGGLKLADYFISSEFNLLNAGDLDLGGSGPILMPNFNLLIGGGKAGKLYLLNPSDLGKYTTGDLAVPQEFIGTQKQIRPGPAFWTSGSNGPLLYLWGENEALKAFHFNGTLFDATPLLQGTVTTPTGAPGATITISANGSDDTSGIVWASIPGSNYEDTGVVKGVLRALNASKPTQELWNSTLATNDDAGYYAKFVPPVVVNGKMYMPTFSNYSTTNYVNVYGLLPAPNLKAAAKQ